MTVSGAIQCIGRSTNVAVVPISNGGGLDVELDLHSKIKEYVDSVYLVPPTQTHTDKVIRCIIYFIKNSMHIEVTLIGSSFAYQLSEAYIVRRTCGI